MSEGVGANEEDGCVLQGQLEGSFIDFKRATALIPNIKFGNDV